MQKFFSKNRQRIFGRLSGKIKKCKARFQSVVLFFAGPDSALVQVAVGESYSRKLVKLITSVEGGKSIGTTTFKGLVDFNENDHICTGLCVVATTCEVVALTSSFVGYYGSYKVYVIAKAISRACMEFRNRCKEVQGKKIPGC